MENYVECLVPGKSSIGMKILRIVLYILTAVFFLGSMISLISLLFAIGCGFGAYTIGMRCNVEFEYLYLDREITVDSIFSKTRRKRTATYDTSKIEVMAPMNSYHLDDYRNRQYKEVDYTCGVSEQPENRYVMYYDGSQKVILQPSIELVKAVQNVTARKVFTE